MSAPVSPAVRRLLVTVGINSFGTGLTLPFTLILLHEVRHIALPTVGLLLAVPGVIGLAAVPFGGTLIDRIGPRATLRLALALQLVGNCALAFATSPSAAVPALALVGAGLGPSFPAISSLLNGLVTGGQVQRAFGVQFTVLNAAIGLGGLVGAGLVDEAHPWTFEVLYLGNALSCLLMGLLLPAAARPVLDADEVQPSYREAFADPLLLKVCFVSLLLALTGYAALDAGLPAFARVEGHVSPSVIALVFAVNTAVIVGGQLAMLKVLRGRPRTSALALAAASWALSWALLGLVPGLSQPLRVAAVLVFGGVFGIGEMFLAPSLQPLVNALASDRLRGRYNAASGACFSVAFVVSPAISGLLIGNGLGEAWLTGVVIASMVAATVALRLRSQLTPEQEGLGLQAQAESGLQVVL